MDISIENDETTAEQLRVHQLYQMEELLAPEIICTLPHSFNSMIGESIFVETDHPRELIRLLGEKLGIEDYRMNMATFWLLDTITLEIIRNKEKLNPVELGIMVSWIAGEAKLIQEKQYSRAEFFQEMNSIFDKVHGQLNKGQSMVYWEEVAGVYEPSQMTERQQSEEEFAFESASEPLRLTVLEGIEKQNNLDTPMTFDSVEKVLSQHSSNLISKNHQDYPILKTSTYVLEAIIKSTYSVYGNSFHYATIKAAFSHTVEIYSYQLPYTLRFPRLIKPPVSSSATVETQTVKSKTDKGNPNKNKGKEKSKSKLPTATQPPLSSMTDDEMMSQKRRYILPLMESNEAVDLIDQFTQLRSIGVTTETIVEKKITKKGKRK